jgi:hypothetical protein
MQVLGEQATGTTHAPLTHDRPNCAQFWQTGPPLPHWPSSVPGRHVLPLVPPQQPEQLSGVHGVPGMHVPEQNSPGSQAWHVLPSCPHADSDCPSTHTPFRQQPLGHVSGPHVVSVHVPPTPLELATHCPVPSVGTHRVHCTPRVPHATSSMPGAQMLGPRQQPEQLSAPQFDAGAAQVPLQRSPGAQTMQGCPNEPHAWGVVSRMHVSPWQQPPAQVTALQPPRGASNPAGASSTPGASG